MTERVGAAVLAFGQQSKLNRGSPSKVRTAQGKQTAPQASAEGWFCCGSETNLKAGIQEAALGLRTAGGCRREHARNVALPEPCAL